MLERGGKAVFTVNEKGVPVSAGSVTWTGSPTSAVTIAGSGSAQFSDTGMVTIHARVGSATTTSSFHISVPPTILFDLQDSGGTANRDVYRMTLDGLQLQPLSSGAGDNEQPTAASTTVIFTSYRDGYAALYQVPLAGGGETRLGSVPAPASQASLSADGTHLAFISPLGGIDHLWTAAGDGTGPAAATGGPGFSTALQASPNWGPNGDTLAMVTTQYGNAAIARLAIVTGAETAITDGVSTDVEPAWSPDGTRIAFASTRDGDLGIFVLTLATGTVVRVTPSPGSDGEPTWLRDGRIVYTWNIGSTTQLRWVDPAHPDTTWVIPTPTGGSPRRATASP
jgi:Tol biopolymer transport system component